jgi:hypothetical protein
MVLKESLEPVLFGLRASPNRLGELLSMTSASRGHNAFKIVLLTRLDDYLDSSRPAVSFTSMCKADCLGSVSGQ